MYYDFTKCKYSSESASELPPAKEFKPIPADVIQTAEQLQVLQEAQTDQQASSKQTTAPRGRLPEPVDNLYNVSSPMQQTTAQTDDPVTVTTNGTLKGDLETDLQTEVGQLGEIDIGSPNDEVVIRRKRPLIVSKSHDKVIVETSVEGQVLDNSAVSVPLITSNPTDIENSKTAGIAVHGRDSDDDAGSQLLTSSETIPTGDKLTDPVETVATNSSVETSTKNNQVNKEREQDTTVDMNEANYEDALPAPGDAEQELSEEQIEANRKRAAESAAKLAVLAPFGEILRGGKEAESVQQTSNVVRIFLSSTFSGLPLLLLHQLRFTSIVRVLLTID